jgi:DNA primase
MIEKETIDKIFDSANIVEVVSDFVNLKKRGVNYLGNCPFHNEKTPSFTVSPAKGIFKCFGCGKGGNSVNFIMEHEQLSYVEALKYLAKKYHIEVEETEYTPEQKEQHDARESMLVLNTFAQKTFTYNLFETEEGKAVGYKYFKERGFTDSTIKKFELGYCRSGRNHFSELAQNKGYQLKFLSATGLSIVRDDNTIFDRFSERVVFPIHNLMGNVIGFGGRTLRTDKSVAKYLNSPESEIYHKSNSLYGIFQAKKAITQHDKCFLVEGYTDVMSMHQSGIENTVASSGTSLTHDQIRLIRRFTQNITVLYDGDAAGIKAALRGIDMVLEEEMNVRVVLLLDGEDPDSYAQKHSSTEVLDFIAQNETDFILFKTKLLLGDTDGDPVKKANLITDIVRTISVIPNSITRAVYVKECSQLMDVDEKVLHTEINKQLHRKQDQWYQKEQAPPKNPEGVALNREFAENKKYEAYDKELLRLLLTYGHKTLFTIVSDKDQPSDDVTVARYIITELSGEIDIKTPVYKKMYDLYVSTYETGQMPTPALFSLNENAKVSSVAASLLSDTQLVSKMWGRKGSYISTEEDNLKEVIDRAINGYKAELVLQILKETEEEIKKLQDQDNAEEQMQQLFAKYTAYTGYKKEIAKILGNRILLGR